MMHMNFLLDEPKICVKNQEIKTEDIGIIL